MNYEKETNKITDLVYLFTYTSFRINLFSGGEMKLEYIRITIGFLKLIIELCWIGLIIYLVMEFKPLAMEFIEIINKPDIVATPDPYAQSREHRSKK
jgi:hypothetical protein